MIPHPEDAALSLPVRVKELEAREAEAHAVLAELWSLTNPEEVAPELLARLHRVLGADDPDGHCGNDICTRLSEAEQIAVRVKEYLQHKDECIKYTYSQNPCDCGLASLLAVLEATQHTAQKAD